LGTDEAFPRVKIGAQLRDQGWDVLNPNTVRFGYVCPDKAKADYVLCDRHGRSLAVMEGKEATGQAILACTFGGDLVAVEPVGEAAVV
jgi:type I site-specific restriction endonuclease